VLQAQLESGAALDAIVQDCQDECSNRCGNLGLTGDAMDGCMTSCSEPRCEQLRTSAITSGRIRTAGKVALAPSGLLPTVRIEASVMVPVGAGLWSAFWMLPEMGAQANCSGCGVYGQWPASGEIDIMEAANQGTSVNGTVHFGGNGQDFFITGTSGPATPNAYQTYALEWDGDSMQWYAGDNQLPYLVANSTASVGGAPGWFTTALGAGPDAPFDVPFHLIFNLAVGGAYTGTDLATAQQTLAGGAKQMYIDKVTVCAQLGSVSDA